MEGVERAPVSLKIVRFSESERQEQLFIGWYLLVQR